MKGLANKIAVLILAIILMVPTFVKAGGNGDADKLQYLYTTKSEINAQLEVLQAKRDALDKSQNKIENGICTKEDVTTNKGMTPQETLEKYRNDIAELQKQVDEKEKSIDELDYLVEAYDAIVNNDYKSVYGVIEEYGNTVIPSEPGKSGNEFINPVKGAVVTSPFGTRTHPIFKVKRFHTGIDLASSMGTPIVAAESGVVVHAKMNSGYGNTVLIMHTNGYFTLYAHIKEKGILVKKGDEVVKGQKIALMGSTGFSTGPHLHFEVIKGSNRHNPLNFIKVK